MSAGGERAGRPDRRVLLATRNAGKIAELQRILAPWRVTLVGLSDLGDYTEPAETGATFAENATAKARHAAAASGLIAVADDSGLTVDALHGMPGVLSARWCGRHGDDAANLELLLAQTAEVPDDRRGAAFVCAAALATPDGRVERVVHGQLRGQLLRARRGSGGFGYDPVFQPEGYPQSTAQMTPEGKDAISHRGQAFRALAPFVAELLDPTAPSWGAPDREQEHPGARHRPGRRPPTGPAGGVSGEP